MQMTTLGNDELGPLRNALILAGLPVDDLSHSGRRFLRFSQAGNLVAFVGIEGEGADRLLRSLVVLEDQRGRGTGAAVLAALESLAKSEGVERLHLLTDSAARFFTAQGYQERDRSLAPASISATAQFRSLCPASATYLSKDLG
ncbi:MULTISPECIES: arsenic resistance N-acetyltransferase ArsN2 [Pseudomonas]|uniref:arsenic resistance N-acetyltransferase ArsN2 n=1 Tax=Pseudomonas TaxID=286 RepID=UPI001BE5DC82|nr:MULTISPECIES: arsenic resistance N-acetyltransferase ArsN2 [Pseudomonas]MBT2339091.1 GNAT family N-acetyltransferase [Pseudomonas fluorescens]MCD4528189.1 arsenic resistance N-acetyltransferase ArsN2 [Pseudomonas sp. C3-2018]